VLDIWNMSVSGTRENYGLTYAESAIIPKTPDLLFVSYGHNDGADTVLFRWGIQSLVETVAAQSPRTEILLIAQNPETGNSYQQAHAAELADLTAEEDVGLVDVLGAFEATGNPSAYVNPDGVHPTVGGSWLGTLGWKGCRREERPGAGDPYFDGLIVPTTCTHGRTGLRTTKAADEHIGSEAHLRSCVS
jgi:hypothetical protein